MRIKEFSIRRYGPLPDTGRVALDDFSLLFGENEDGKTLTIDALVKLLLHQLSPQRLKDLFKNINRVDEDPDGYLIIEDESGEEIKLPDKGDLASITDLTPEECRNIFVIRNSELSIALESEFYGNVTDRLTGLRTEEILSIKRELQELGKLTNPSSTASLRDVAGEKLKTRTTNAEELIENIAALGKMIEQEELDRLEETLHNIRGKISEIDSMIKTFEDARKREKYEKGSEAYEALISAQQNLQELESYSNEDAKLWEECVRYIKDWEKETEKLQSKVDGEKRKFEQKETALKEERAGFEILRDRKKRIDNEIEPERKIYEMGIGKVRSEEIRSSFFTAAAITSAALLLISILGLIMNPSPLLYGLLASFLISTGVFAALRFSYTREKAHLAAVFERIRLATSRFELAGENIQEILSNIQKFDEEYSKREFETQEADKELSSLEKEIKRLTETDIADLEKKIREAARKIQDLTQKSGVRTLGEYNEKLQMKLGYEKSSETQGEILKSHFGSKGENSKENLSYWHNEIEALKEFEHKARGITYDEKTVSQLRSNRETFLGEEQELESKAAKFYEQLKEIERKVNEILQLKNNYLHCATSVDLKAIRDKLLGFRDKVETEKDNAVEAISIFEDLQREEEEKISTLFGKDSPISQHFREITGGIYQEVEFVHDEMRKVQVRLTDGSTLDADKLSGGAYDQLYLSIRLALGEKLLQGNKGFFIMDDPFIKADKERLQRQIDILNRISQSGWQIIYFTAKDEVKDALKQDIENGNVSYMELPSISLQQNLGVGHTTESTSSPNTASQTNQGKLLL